MKREVVLSLCTRQRQKYREILTRGIDPCTLPYSWNIFGKSIPEIEINVKVGIQNFRSRFIY